MVIRATPTELEVCGSQTKLAALAERIARAHVHGEVSEAADLNADPRPYERGLARLRVRVTAGPVCVAVLDELSVVSGETHMLEACASFFQFDPSARAGEHYHYEWFDGNAYVAPNSRPLVVSIG